MTDGLKRLVAVAIACMFGGAMNVAGQQAGTGAAIVSPNAGGTTIPLSEYRIGPGDVLNIVFWRQKDLSAEVTVRPDGRITLPLLNDIDASGLFPDELRQSVFDKAGRFVADATVTVVVKQIHSRLVYITGQVEKPGPYPMYGPLRVMQLIAAAAGLREYADADNIIIIRIEGDRQKSYRFNYNDVVKRRELTQNIELRPGDTVVVP